MRLLLLAVLAVALPAQADWQLIEDPEEHVLMVTQYDLQVGLAITFSYARDHECNNMSMYIDNIFRAEEGLAEKLGVFYGDEIIVPEVHLAIGETRKTQENARATYMNAMGFDVVRQAYEINLPNFLLVVLSSRTLAYWDPSLHEDVVFDIIELPEQLSQLQRRCQLQHTI